jgi:hypothetical protein
MIKLPELSLYISHTCDIGCASCFTYNNLNWGGHFTPHDDLYKLKDKVEFETITILGGEPTTNPKLNNWMELVESVWPSHDDKWIVTNGRNLSRIPSNWNERGWQLEISAHSPADLKSVFEWFEKEYPNITYEKFTEQHEDGDTHYYMRNGIDGPVFGKISEAWFFYKESLIAKPGEVLTWDRLVDAEQAHANCIARECMYFLEGRFYRCARQALLPQLAKTFQIDAQYRELASQDLGCTVEEFVEWSKTRLEPQSQCAFCPWAEIIKLPEVSNLKKIKVLQV